MTNEYPPLSPAAVASERGREWRYLMLAIAANVAIWGTTLFLLKDSPRIYTSQWSVMLLSKGSRAIANPANGSMPLQAAASSSGGDVKAVYKVIVATDTVRRMAAGKVGMTTQQFGRPGVETTPDSDLITVAMIGSSREESQRKASALYESFQERLNQLRVQQAEEQEARLENSLSLARKKLDAAQSDLSKYKLVSQLVSTNQIDQLASNIEALRRSRAEIIAQQQDASTRARQLVVDLKLSSQIVADAFTLRADTLFQQYLRDYSDATVNLANLTTKFGPNHPVVVRETARQTSMQAALQERGQLLLGRPLDPTELARLNLGNTNQGTTAREDLYKIIVTNNIERQGLTARVQELDRQIYQLEQRLLALSQPSLTIDAYNRNVELAQAALSSQLAGLSNTQIDVFSVYPPIQLVAEPTLPETGIIPQQKPFFISAAVASLMVSSGLLALWLRKHSRFKHWIYQNDFVMPN